MDRNTLAAAAALAKSAALVNYKGSMSIEVTRYTLPEGGEGVQTKILLHGRDGIDYARSNGVTPSAWYSDDRPQRNYSFQEDGVDVLVLEVAPTGSKLVNGELVLPQVYKLSEAVQ